MILPITRQRQYMPQIAAIFIGRLQLLISALFTNEGQGQVVLVYCHGRLDALGVLHLVFGKNVDQHEDKALPTVSDHGLFWKGLSIHWLSFHHSKPGCFKGKIYSIRCGLALFKYFLIFLKTIEYFKSSIYTENHMYNYMGKCSALKLDFLMPFSHIRQNYECCKSLSIVHVEINQGTRKNINILNLFMNNNQQNSLLGKTDNLDPLPRASCRVGWTSRLVCVLGLCWASA